MCALVVGPGRLERLRAAEERDVLVAERSVPVLAIDDLGVATGKIPLPAVEAAMELTGVAATRRQPPAPVRIEALLGVAPEPPFRIAGDDALPQYLRLPVPSLRSMQEGATHWLFPFYADSAYHPPAESPLQCDAPPDSTAPELLLLTCQAREVEDNTAWEYYLEFRPDYGTGLLLATRRE